MGEKLFDWTSNKPGRVLTSSSYIGFSNWQIVQVPARLGHQKVTSPTPPIDGLLMHLLSCWGGKLEKKSDSSLNSILTNDKTDVHTFVVTLSIQSSLLITCQEINFP